MTYKAPIWQYESIEESRQRKLTELHNLKTAVTTLADSEDPLALARAKALLTARKQAEAQAKYKTEQAKKVRDAQAQRQQGGGGGLLGKALKVGSYALDPFQDLTEALQGNIAVQYGDVQNGQLGFSKESILSGLGNTVKEVGTLGFSDAFQKRQEKVLGELGREADTSFWGNIKQLSDVGEKDFYGSERIPAGFKTGSGLALDPLTTMVLPGVLGAVAKSGVVQKLPIASKLAKAALTGKYNPVGGLLEGPGNAGYVGLLAGAGAGAEIADRVNIPLVPDRFENLVGSGLGGILGGGALGAATRGVRNAATARAVAEDGVPYLRAGEVVDGLEVGRDIPNTSSISASLGEDFREVPGIREVSMSDFNSKPTELFYAKDDIDRAKALAEEIKRTGRIDPLIIAIDSEGPYVLEGGHRMAALSILGKKTFPALVVEEPGAKYPSLSFAGNTRLAMTEEVGPDTRLFHGTRVGFQGDIRPGTDGLVWASLDPKVADDYTVKSFADGTSARVYPLRSAEGLTLLSLHERLTPDEVSRVIAAAPENIRGEIANSADASEVYRALVKAYSPNGRISGATPRDSWLQAADVMQRAGFDGFKSDTSIAIFDPSKLRSEFAVVSEAEAENMLARRRNVGGGNLAGLPKGITNSEDIHRLLASVEGKARAGVEGRYWYENSGGYFLDAAQGNTAVADRLARIAAYTSPRNNVVGQGSFILKAWDQFTSGDPVRVHFPASDAMLNHVLPMDGKEWDDAIVGLLKGDIPDTLSDIPGIAGDIGQWQKVSNFYLDLLDEIDPERAMRLRKASGATVTVDMWMARAFGYESDALTPAQYAFVADSITKVANKLGWKPKQVQAAVWVAKRMDDAASKGKKFDPAFDFKQSLERHLAQVSWETAPGKGTELERITQGFEEAPLEVQAEYHRAVHRALTDDQGRDILANEMKLLTPGEFDGPGVYEGQLHPGTQTRVLAPPAPETGVKQATVYEQSQNHINAYMAAKGYVLDQNAMAWTKMFPDAPKFSHNGVAFNLGREISDDEAQSLSRLLADDPAVKEVAPYGVAIVPTSDGAWVFRVPTEDDVVARQGASAEVQKALRDANRLFHERAASHLDTMLPDTTIRTQTFASGGDYLEVNNSGDYLGRLGSFDTPALRQTLEQLKGRVRQTADDFSRRYGWGEYAPGGPKAAGTRGGELDTRLRLLPEDQQAEIDAAAREWMSSRVASDSSPGAVFSAQKDYHDFLEQEIKNAEQLNDAGDDARHYAAGAQEVSDDFIRKVEGFPLGESYAIGAFRQYEGRVGRLGREVELDTNKTMDLGKEVGYNPEADWMPLYQALHDEGAVPENLRAYYSRLRLDATAVGRQFEADMKRLGEPWNPSITNEKYFPRYWRRVSLTGPEVEARLRSGGSGFGTRRAFQKHRSDASFTELATGIFEDKQGFYRLEPLSKDPAKMLALRKLQGIEFVEQKAFIKRVTDPVLSVGVKVDRRTGLVPEGYRVPRIPAFEGKPVSFIVKEEDTAGIRAALEEFGFDAADQVAPKQRAALRFTEPIAVPKNLADLLEGMYGPPLSLGQIGKFDILNAIQTAGGIAKRTKLVGSFFQQVDFATRSGFAAFGAGIDALLRGQPVEAAVKIAKFPKQVGDIIRANISPSFRRQLQEEILSDKVLFSQRPDLTLKLVADNGWIQHDASLMARDIRRSLQESIDEAAASADKSALRAARGRLKQIDKAMQTGLFDGVYPQSQKFALENFILPRLIEQHPDWSSAQIAANAAMEVNKMFSTLGNFQSVIKNRPLKTILHSLIFSTNETESFIRQAGSVFAGPNKRLWGSYYLGGAVFLAATANLIHLAATGEMLPWDRYNPIDYGDKPGARYNKLGIGIGYNSNFLQPQIPFLRGRSGSRVDLDLMGQMDTALRMLDPISFFQARENVLPRALVNQAMGEDFYGRPIDTVGPRGVVSRAQQFAQDVFQPIGAGMVAEAARQTVPGVDKIIPENEGRIGPAGSLVQASGLNLGGEGTKELLDRYARDEFGTGYDDLEPVQKSKLVENNPTLKKELEVRRKTSAERQDASAILGEKVDTIREQQQAADELFLTGNVRREDWLKSRADRLHEVSVLKQDYFTDKKRRDPKTPLDFYFKAIEEATNPDTGEVNWTAVDAWRQMLPEEDQAYIERNTGISDTPLGKLLRKMQSEYYSLPRYRGFTSDEAVLLDQLWQEVRNAAGSSDKSKMNRAVSQVAAGYPPKIVRGVRLRIWSDLPGLDARDRWKKRNPASAIFLGGGTLTPRDMQAVQKALASVD